MKTSRIVVASIATGLLLGVGTTAAKLSYSGSGADSPDGAAVATADGSGHPREPGQPQPRVVIDKLQYDFGTMERGASGSHAFVFTNEGNAPLELKQGSTSCKCTWSELPRNRLDAGQSMEVTLEWTTKVNNGAFRQHATILTNDPEHARVELTVVGRIADTLSVLPPQLAVGNMAIDEVKTARVRLISNVQDDLAVLSHKWLDSKTAESFDVLVEPLPEEEKPHKDVKSGLVVTVTVKAGLPVGSVHQSLELMTNSGSSGNIAVLVPIRGTIVSDISIVGRGWNAKRGVLSLGTFPSREGAQRKLSIFVRGERASDIRLSTLSVTPSELQVSIGEPKEFKRRSVVKVPLTVEIPKGTPGMAFLGTPQGQLGEITIETNHPHAKRLRLLVRFAVQP